MKRFYGLASMMFVAMSSTLSAANPDMYLKGPGAAIKEHDWEVHDYLKFTENNGNYSIHIDKLDGQFKISNADWTLNYGASFNSENIYSSVILEGILDGANINANELNNVDISFKLNPDGSTPITIIVDGQPVKAEYETMLSGTLPVLYINVYTDEAHSSLDNEIIDKDLSHKNYFKYAEYWLDVNGCKWLEELGAKSVGSKDEPLPLQIKARGNYTRTGFAKKPFKLKLDNKQNLLGLTPDKSKHYAILAHADDNKGYLRNFTGFNLGKRIGLPWTPSQQPIEVVMNGNYRGLYFLTESIRVGDGRVPITELGDNVSDPELVTGGYLVELDNYDEDNQIRITEKPYSNGDPVLRVTFDTPEEYSSLQYKFVEQQFNAMNDAIGDNSDEIWSYLDLDDAARYYIVEEIISHTESYHGSTYLYRDRGANQKWHFSPLWDCGNAFNGSAEDYFIRTSPYGNTWIHSLLKNKTFLEKVKETWKWFMSNNYDGIDKDIESFTNAIQEAAVADRKRWRDAPRPNSGDASYVVDNTDMNSRRSEVLWHLNTKVNFLKKEFGDFSDTTYPEPQRDLTPAAQLPDFVSTAVTVINSDNIAGEAQFFNLQGIRVNNPESGIYIRVSNGISQKIVIE